MAGLITQQSLKNNQYPKNITEANNVLSNHKFDQVKPQRNHTNVKKNPQETPKKDKESEKINLSFAQLEGKCYCCRKTGNLSPQCCFKDKPKEEWFINKSPQLHVQANKKEKSKKDKESEKINLSFAQVESKCYCCGKTGHMSPQCCFKDKPREKWFINKTQQSHVQKIGRAHV